MGMALGVGQRSAVAQGNEAADTGAVDLSIIIVTWNVWPLLSACLASIARCSAPYAPDLHEEPGPPSLYDVAEQDAAEQVRTFGPTGAYRLEVIVVDNGGSDETETQLPQRFPWVRYIRSPQNLGFTAGNNLGYRASQGATIFFLNPDTELSAAANACQAAATAVANPLTTLYEMLRADPTLGMVGPQLRYGDGSWQNSRRHFPTRGTGFWESTWLGQFWVNNPWTRHMHMRGVPHEQPHEVDWINGSAMFCRRSALAAIRQPGDPGPFDERFFMYSEELDLCQRMKLAGWQIWYMPQVQVLHYEGRSSEQVVVHRHIRFNTSKVRYYQKYYGTTWAVILRIYLQAEYVLQILLETLKLLLRHKPTLRRERIQGYWHILRSGFPLV